MDEDEGENLESGVEQSHDEELDDKQFEAVYAAARSSDSDMKQAEPPDTFLLSLKPYQKQALLCVTNPILKQELNGAS